MPAPPRIRILSIDGGGIYGLAGAIWLRRLCEREPLFLGGKDIQLFAGTSSGAINSLLLARHAEPRKAVLDGALERFWSDPRPFQNNDPALAMASFLGGTGWFSGKDFLAHLRDTFGDMRLGDLPQEVLISTFNWRGGDKPTPTRAGQATRHWKPKFFSNSLNDDADNDVKVADIAYAAAAPPNLRPIYGGLGDGASFSASPVVEAVAVIVRHCHLVSVNGETELQVLRRRAELMRDPETFNVGAVLDRVAVLSLGSGQQLPWLAGEGEVNAGFNFSQLATNPAQGDFWGTSAYALDASTEAAEFVVKQLVGRDRALRLNPGVLRVPTVMAALIARFPMWWQWLLASIREGAGGKPSSAAIDATLRFLRTPQGWDITDSLGNQQWSPQRENPRLQLAGRPAFAARGNELVAVYASAEGEGLLAAVSRDVGQSFDVPTPVEAGAAESVTPETTALVDSQGEPSTPGLAFFGGTYWLAERAPGRIRLWTSADGTRWSRAGELPSQGRGAPNLASNGSVLVLAEELNGDVALYRLTEPGGSWTGPAQELGRVGACPSLAGGSAGFLLAFRGPEESTIWVSTSPDGVRWRPATELTSYVILEESPGLTYSESTGLWHMAWRREAWPPNIWVSASTNGLQWTPPVKLHDRATRDAPCLVGVSGTVLMGWLGTGENSLWSSRLAVRGGAPPQMIPQRVARGGGEAPR
jgi:predicted acylesterase/phospholipase RssA